MNSLAFLGIIFVIVAIFGGQFLEGGSPLALLNFPAFVIVMGGTLGAVMLQSSLKALVRSLKMFFWVFKPPFMNYENGIKKMVVWSNVARKQGFLGLEKHLDKIEDDFEKKALSLLIDGNESNTIRDVLLIEVNHRQHDIFQSVRIYDALGGYAPTLGIVGAVLGLIQVMGELSDPSQLGPGIATAFVATIYGVGFANLLFLPVANKLRNIVQAKKMYQEMIIEGVALISEGENPKVIKSRLDGFRPL